MVQDPQRLAIAFHLAHVLGELVEVQLDAAEQEQLGAQALERVAIAGLHPVIVGLVVGDGQEIVAARLVLGHQRGRRADAVREGRVRVQVAAQQRHQPRSARAWAAIWSSRATQSLGVWRAWSTSSRRQAKREGRPMICGWKVKLVTPPTSVMPSSSVSQPCSTGPGAWIARWPVKRKYGASSSTHETGISNSRRPAAA